VYFLDSALSVQQEAVEDLTYAFEHCPRGAEVNKARCAYYLIPARMLLGDLPKQEVLQRFNLQHYVPIMEVIVLHLAILNMQ